MKFLLFSLVIGAITLSQHSFATTITCAHSSVCTLVKEILPEQEIKLESIINKLGDAHHFSPSQKQIKLMLKAPLLIIPPLELVPWATNLVKKRKDNKTIVMNSKNLPLTGDIESLSHFWLHPKLICFHKIALATQIKELWKVNVQKPTCATEESLQVRFDNLKKEHSQKFFVLTHDALSPLFERTFENIITIKGSHHGESIHPSSLKKLHQFISKAQDSSIIWIVEKQIAVPSRISQKIRQKDIKLTIDTSADNLESSTQVLKNVLDSLEKSL